MAQQEITIRVTGKRAETDFGDLVSFNENSYRLKFDFDSEWNDYSQRVAVVLWAGGCAEQVFTGSACDMPAVASPDCDTALVGVYSSNGAGKRIASSFVRLRCLPGAYCEPPEASPKSLHEQILDLLNAFDFSALGVKLPAGTYSSVEVNAYGFVTGGKQIVEIGGEGQTQPSSSLADGGIFFRKEEDGYTLCHYEDGTLTAITGLGGGSGGAVTSVNGLTGAVTIDKFDLGLPQVALTGSYNDLEDLPAAAAVTSVNGLTGAVTIDKFDLGLPQVALTGSYNDLEDLPAAAAVTSVNGLTGAVTIDKFDLGLPQVALTGSYNDLLDKPTSTGGGGAVTSVNGLTGAVTIDKFDLGLGAVENARQMPLGDSVRFGANFNSLDDTGCYYVQGTADLPCTNGPTSSSNSLSNCRWFLMTFSHNDAGQYVTQVAFSLMSDCAVRIRNKAGSSWGSWKTVI